MRKLFLILISCLVFAPVMVLAKTKTVVTPPTDFGKANLETAAGSEQGYYSNRTDFNTIFGDVVGGILALAGTIFLILTVYGGITWMTAMGNSDKVEKAKSIIIAAVIGIAITASAYAITYFIMNKIGGAGPQQTCAQMANNNSYECITASTSDCPQVGGVVGVMNSASDCQRCCIYYAPPSNE